MIKKRLENYTLPALILIHDRAAKDYKELDCRIFSVQTLNPLYNEQIIKRTKLGTLVRKLDAMIHEELLKLGECLIE